MVFLYGKIQHAMNGKTHELSTGPFSSSQTVGLAGGMQPKEFTGV